MNADATYFGDTSLASGKARDISRHLQTAIFEQRLMPGAKLSEDEVGELFGASRTLVRSSLQALAHSGLVDIKRNRGAFVAQPTVRDAEEVFEARSLLEPVVAKRAARFIDSAEIATLKAHIEAEHQALAEGDRGRALSLSGQFHALIAVAADHVVYADMVRALIAKSSLIIALYASRADAACESHAHDVLIGAFEKSDEQQAHDVMRSHLVDIYSGLNLAPPTQQQLSLADALRL